MLPVNPKNKKKSVLPNPTNPSTAMFDVSCLPKEMDIYWNDFASFLPEGVEFKDLSEVDKQIVRDQYRFAFLRPGKYQAITGLGNIQ